MSLVHTKEISLTLPHIVIRLFVGAAVYLLQHITLDIFQSIRCLLDSLSYLTSRHFNAARSHRIQSGCTAFPAGQPSATKWDANQDQAINCIGDFELKILVSSHFFLMFCPRTLSFSYTLENLGESPQK